MIWTLLEMTREQNLSAFQQQLMVWCGALMAVILVGGVALTIWKRRWQAPDEESDPTGGLTIMSLRTMRDRGELTVAEYEAAKAQIVAKMKGAMKEKEKEKETKKKPPLGETGENSSV